MVEGTIVFYEITVTNTGDVALSGITLVDDHTDLATSPPRTARSRRTSRRGELHVRLQRRAALGTTTNTATAGSAETDPETASARVVAIASGGVHLAISKGVSPSANGPFGSSLTVYEGTTVYYRIVVSNPGTPT